MSNEEFLSQQQQSQPSLELPTAPPAHSSSPSTATTPAAAVSPSAPSPPTSVAADEEPPTPESAELMRDIENYDAATLDRLLTKLANRSASSSSFETAAKSPPQQQEPPGPSLADRILTVFPDACPDWVSAEAAKYEAEIGPYAAAAGAGNVDLEPLVNRWLTHGYRKRVKKWQHQQQQEQQQNQPDAAPVTEAADPDEGTMFDWRRQMRDFQLRQPVFDALALEFPSVSRRSLSQVVKAFKYCLPAAYRFLYKVLAYTGQLATPEAAAPVNSSSSVSVVQISDATAAADASGDSSLKLTRLPFDCPHQLTLTASSAPGQCLKRRPSDNQRQQADQQLLTELRFVRSLLADQMAAVISAFQWDQDSASLEPSTTVASSSAAANCSPSPRQSAAYECECCFGDFQFDEMCQCPEGHLFCRPCLAAYVKEKVYGTGRLTLQCLAPDCERLFLRSQLLLAVDEVTLAKLDERAAEDSVRSITRLFRCPACNWGAEIAEEGEEAAGAETADGAAAASSVTAAAAGPAGNNNNKVFTCLNCEKEVCRLCGVDWEEHFGKRCSEIEQDSETRLRREFEERMTQARVRTCYQCKASVMKSAGCNHITCRCGAHFCYICRAALSPQDPYSHFCNHGNPNSCNCGRCPVQSSTEQDEKRAISELRAQGLKRQRDEGFQERPIGPDQPESAKRSRRS